MELSEIGSGLDSSGLGLGPVAPYYEFGNKLSNSIKAAVCWAK
jgi:hypothetical protein